MNTSGMALRVLASALSALIFLEQGYLLHAAEAHVWESRRIALHSAPRPASLSSLPSPTLVHPSASPRRAAPAVPATPFDTLLSALPPRLGSVRNIEGPSDAPLLVLHIQDVHGNQEAQTNISAAIRSLADKQAIGLIAVEGAFAPIDVETFRAYPHAPSARKAADYLLEKNRIGGAVHAGLTGANLPIVGVDDEIHYNANVAAYRESTSVEKMERLRLQEERRRLDLEKTRVLNPALARFDDAVSRHNDGALELGAFALVLDETRSSLSRFPHHATMELDRFLETYRLETSLDLAKVESQRERVLMSLATRLTPASAETLTAQSVAYRLGKIGHADFYRFLQQVCTVHGIRLSDTPAFNDYVRYMLLADRLDAAKLFNEMTELETRLADALCTSEEERALLAQSRRLRLESKLVDLSLTKGEWNQLEAVPSASFLVRGENTPNSLLGTRHQALGTFADFYRHAEARDAAMAANLLAGMKEKGVTTAVLVTGGFHADGIRQQLTASGARVVPFVPAMTKADTGSPAAYLSLFAREKTPLDRIFEGEKLFLSLPALPDPVRREATVVYAATGLHDGTVPFTDSSSWFQRAMASVSDWTLDKAQRTTEGLTLTLRSAGRTFKIIVAYDENDRVSVLALGTVGLSLTVIKNILDPFGTVSSVSWMGFLGVLALVWLHRKTILNWTDNEWLRPLPTLVGLPAAGGALTDSNKVWEIPTHALMAASNDDPDKLPRKTPPGFDRSPEQSASPPSQPDAPDPIVHLPPKEASRRARPIYGASYFSISKESRLLIKVGEGHLAHSRKFLGASGKLKKREIRRKNGVFGISEVFLLPESKTRNNMLQFQNDLQQLLGNKIFPVRENMHILIQSLERVAIHPDMQKIDLSAPPIQQALEGTARIPFRSGRYWIYGVNWSPEMGIFFELQPMDGDTIGERRKGWKLGSRHTPHIVGAYIAAPLNAADVKALNKLLDAYNKLSFGEILVDNLALIAFEDPALTMGHTTLLRIKGTPIPPAQTHWVKKILPAWMDHYPALKAYTVALLEFTAHFALPLAPLAIASLFVGDGTSPWLGTVVAAAFLEAVLLYNVFIRAHDEVDDNVRFVGLGHSLLHTAAALIFFSHFYVAVALIFISFMNHKEHDHTVFAMNTPVKPSEPAPDQTIQPEPQPASPGGVDRRSALKGILGTIAAGNNLSSWNVLSQLIKIDVAPANVANQIYMEGWISFLKQVEEAGLMPAFRSRIGVQDVPHDFPLINKLWAAMKDWERAAGPAASSGDLKQLSTLIEELHSSTRVLLAPATKIEKIRRENERIRRQREYENQLKELIKETYVMYYGRLDALGLLNDAFIAEGWMEEEDQETIDPLAKESFRLLRKWRNDIAEVTRPDIITEEILTEAQALCSRFTLAIEYLIKARDVSVATVMRDWTQALLPDGMTRFDFVRGMAFGDRTMWWNRHDNRPQPLYFHSGIDFARTVDESGRIHPIPEGMSIASPLAGRVMATGDDEMRSSLYLETDILDAEGRRLVLVFAHIELERAFKPGERISAGDALGRALPSKNNLSSVPPHLHLSAMWMTADARARVMDTVNLFKPEPGIPYFWPAVDRLSSEEGLFSYTDPLTLFRETEAADLFQRTDRGPEIVIIHPTKTPPLFEFKKPLSFRFPGARITDIRGEWDWEIEELLVMGGNPDIIVSPDATILARMASMMNSSPNPIPLIHFNGYMPQFLEEAEKVLSPVQVRTEGRVDGQVSAAVQALNTIEAVRTTMDRSVLWNRPLIVWQNGSPGEWYPPVTPLLARNLRVTEMTGARLHAIVRQENPTLEELARARIILIRSPLETDDLGRDPTLDRVRYFMEWLGCPVLFIDHSTEPLSQTQRALMDQMPEFVRPLNKDKMLDQLFGPRKGSTAIMLYNAAALSHMPRVASPFTRPPVSTRDAQWTSFGNQVEEAYKIDLAWQIAEFSRREEAWDRPMHKLLAEIRRGQLYGLLVPDLMRMPALALMNGLDLTLASRFPIIWHDKRYPHSLDFHGLKRVYAQSGVEIDLDLIRQNVVSTLGGDLMELPQIWRDANLAPAGVLFMRHLTSYFRWHLHDSLSPSLHESLNSIIEQVVAPQATILTVEPSSQVDQLGDFLQSRSFTDVTERVVPPAVRGHLAHANPAADPSPYGLSYGMTTLFGGDIRIYQRDPSQSAQSAVTHTASETSPRNFSALLLFYNIIPGALIASGVAGTWAALGQISWSMAILWAMLALVASVAAHEAWHMGWAKIDKQFFTPVEARHDQVIRFRWPSSRNGWRIGPRYYYSHAFPTQMNTLAVITGPLLAWLVTWLQLDSAVTSIFVWTALGLNLLALIPVNDIHSRLTGRMTPSFSDGDLILHSMPGWLILFSSLFLTAEEKKAQTADSVKELAETMPGLHLAYRILEEATPNQIIHLLQRAEELDGGNTIILAVGLQAELNKLLRKIDQIETEGGRETALDILEELGILEVPREDVAFAPDFYPGALSPLIDDLINLPKTPTNEAYTAYIAKVDAELSEMGRVQRQAIDKILERAKAAGTVLPSEGAVRCLFAMAVMFLDQEPGNYDEFDLARFIAALTIHQEAGLAPKFLTVPGLLDLAISPYVPDEQYDHFSARLRMVPGEWGAQSLALRLAFMGKHLDTIRYDDHFDLTSAVGDIRQARRLLMEPYISQKAKDRLERAIVQLLFGMVPVPHRPMLSQNVWIADYQPYVAVPGDEKTDDQAAVIQAHWADISPKFRDALFGDPDNLNDNFVDKLPAMIERAEASHRRDPDASFFSYTWSWSLQTLLMISDQLEATGNMEDFVLDPDYPEIAGIFSHLKQRTDLHGPGDNNFLQYSPRTTENIFRVMKDVIRNRGIYIAGPPPTAPPATDDPGAGAPAQTRWVRTLLGSSLDHTPLGKAIVTAILEFVVHFALPVIPIAATAAFLGDASPTFHLFMAGTVAAGLAAALFLNAHDRVDQNVYRVALVHSFTSLLAALLWHQHPVMSVLLVLIGLLHHADHDAVVFGQDTRLIRGAAAITLGGIGILAGGLTLNGPASIFLVLAMMTFFIEQIRNAPVLTPEQEKKALSALAQTRADYIQTALSLPGSRDTIVAILESILDRRRPRQAFFITNKGNVFSSGGEKRIRTLATAIDKELPIMALIDQWNQADANAEINTLRVARTVIADLTPFLDKSVLRHLNEKEAAFLSARDTLIHANQRLVLKVAQKFRGKGLPLVDLLQEGNLGLMDAADRVNPELGFRFSTYAVRHIQGRMKEALESKGRPADDLLALIRYLQDTTSPPDSSDALADPGIPAEQSVMRDELAAGLEEALRQLSWRERTIIQLRFGLGTNIQTLQEIAASQDLSKGGIRLIEKRALKKLLHHAAALKVFLPAQTRWIRTLLGSSLDHAPLGKAIVTAILEFAVHFALPQTLMISFLGDSSPSVLTFVLIAVLGALLHELFLAAHDEAGEATRRVALINAVAYTLAALLATHTLPGALVFVLIALIHHAATDAHLFTAQAQPAPARKRANRFVSVVLSLSTALSNLSFANGNTADQGSNNSASVQKTRDRSIHEEMALLLDEIGTDNLLSPEAELALINEVARAREDYVNTLLARPEGRAHLLHLLESFLERRIPLWTYFLGEKKGGYRREDSWKRIMSGLQAGQSAREAIDEWNREAPHAVLNELLIAREIQAHLKKDGGDPDLALIDEKEAVFLSARDRLIKANRPLTLYLAKEYARSIYQLLDLTQEGSIGLLEAAERIDPKRNLKFSTYAGSLIRGHIKSHVRSRRFVRIPRYRLQQYRDMQRAVRHLRRELERKPSAPEIAAHMGAPVSEIIDLLQVSRKPMSLSAPVGNGVTPLSGVIQGNTVAIDHNLNTDDRSNLVKSLLSILTPREQWIVRLRYGIDDGHEHTLQEIGDELGLTRAAIHLIEKKAMAKIKAHIEETQKTYPAQADSTRRAWNRWAPERLATSAWAETLFTINFETLRLFVPALLLAYSYSHVSDFLWWPALLLQVINIATFLFREHRWNRSNAAMLIVLGMAYPALAIVGAYLNTWFLLAAFVVMVAHVKVDYRVIGKEKEDQAPLESESQELSWLNEAHPLGEAVLRLTDPAIIPNQIPLLIVRISNTTDQENRSRAIEYLRDPERLPILLTNIDRLTPKASRDGAYEFLRNMGILKTETAPSKEPETAPDFPDENPAAEGAEEDALDPFADIKTEVRHILDNLNTLERFGMASSDVSIDVSHQEQKGGRKELLRVDLRPIERVARRIENDLPLLLHLVTEGIADSVREGRLPNHPIILIDSDGFRTRRLDWMVRVLNEGAQAAQRGEITRFVVYGQLEVDLVHGLILGLSKQLTGRTKEQRAFMYRDPRNADIPIGADGAIEIVLFPNFKTRPAPAAIQAGEEAVRAAFQAVVAPGQKNQISVRADIDTTHDGNYFAMFHVEGFPKVRGQDVEHIHHRLKADWATTKVFPWNFWFKINRRAVAATPEQPPAPAKMEPVKLGRGDNRYLTEPIQQAIGKFPDLESSFKHLLVALTMLAGEEALKFPAGKDQVRDLMNSIWVLAGSSERVFPAMSGHITDFIYMNSSVTLNEVETLIQLLLQAEASVRTQSREDLVKVALDGEAVTIEEFHTPVLTFTRAFIKELREYNAHHDGVFNWEMLLDRAGDVLKDFNPRSSGGSAQADSTRRAWNRWAPERLAPSAWAETLFTVGLETLRLFVPALLLAYSYSHVSDFLWWPALLLQVINIATFLFREHRWNRSNAAMLVALGMAYPAIAAAGAFLSAWFLLGALTIIAAHLWVDFHALSARPRSNPQHVTSSPHEKLLDTIMDSALAIQNGGRSVPADRFVSLVNMNVGRLYGDISEARTFLSDRDVDALVLAVEQRLRIESQRLNLTEAEAQVLADRIGGWIGRDISLNNKSWIMLGRPQDEKQIRSLLSQTSGRTQTEAVILVDENDTELFEAVAKDMANKRPVRLVPVTGLFNAERTALEDAGLNAALDTFDTAAIQSSVFIFSARISFASLSSATRSSARFRILDAMTLERLLADIASSVFRALSLEEILRLADRALQHA